MLALLSRSTDMSLVGKQKEKSMKSMKNKVTFFSLPPEIRNDIYGLVLMEKGHIELTEKRLNCLVTTPDQRCLINAEARLYRECASLFWASNTFEFTDDSLNQSGIDDFAKAMGKASVYLRHVRVRRTYKIGDMKPTIVLFQIDVRSNELQIIRSEEKVPFPGLPGFAKFKSPYTEPCRCDVKRLAKRYPRRSKGSVNGDDLLAFLEDYVDYVRTTAKSPPDVFEICPVCNTVRRH